MFLHSTKKVQNKVLQTIDLSPYYPSVVNFLNVVFKYLYNFLISNNLLSENQSGFRPGDSTTNQLLFLINQINSSFDERKSLELRAIFLDISKAFDKVWHDELIFKLQQNGVWGNLLSFFQDYLSNRKQRVVINGVKSSFYPVESGVPQGSWFLGHFSFSFILTTLNQILNPMLIFLLTIQCYFQ